MNRFHDEPMRGLLRPERMLSTVATSQAISKLRAKASGAYDDVGITTSTGAAIIAAGDSNSIAFSRTPAQVRV